MESVLKKIKISKTDIVYICIVTRYPIMKRERVGIPFTCLTLPPVCTRTGEEIVFVV
jgi:hypothetical protein